MDDEPMPGYHEDPAQPLPGPSVRAASIGPESKRRQLAPAGQVVLEDTVKYHKETAQAARRRHAEAQGQLQQVNNALVARTEELVVAHKTIEDFVQVQERIQALFEQNQQSYQSELDKHAQARQEMERRLTQQSEELLALKQQVLPSADSISNQNLEERFQAMKKAYDTELAKQEDARQALENRLFQGAANPTQIQDATNPTQSQGATSQAQSPDEAHSTLDPPSNFAVSPMASRFVSRKVQQERSRARRYNILNNPGTPLPVLPFRQPDSHPDSEMLSGSDSEDSEPDDVPSMSDPKVIQAIAHALHSLGVVTAGITSKPSKKSFSARQKVKTKMAMQAQKAQMSKDDDLAYKSLLREVWRKRYAKTTKTDFIDYEPASQEEVEAAENGQAPKGWNLDFSKGWEKSRLNKIILGRLLLSLKNERDANPRMWQILPEVSDEYLMGLLQGQLKRSQEAWKQSQPRYNAELEMMENDQDVMDRLMASSGKRQASTASRSRRTQKFQKRMTTATHILDLKTSKEAVDASEWAYFVKLLKRLDVDGMSSEEEGTVTENGFSRNVFYVHICTWRTPEIASYMEIIDKAATTTGLFNTRGAKPQQRMKSKTIGGTAAAKGLPRGMYRKDWLSSLRPRDREELAVLKDAFQLLVAASERLNKHLTDTPEGLSCSVDTMATFVVQKQVFTKIQGGPTQTFPAIVPPKIDHEPERRINLQSLLDISWVSVQFPFLIAVPTKNPFYAPLFDRLDYRENHFPVVPHGNSFKLRLGTIQEWESLELNLRAIIHAMSEICLIHLPKDFRFWASPRRYGYTKFYASRQAAQGIALQSRNSFVPFIAAATFYLALMDTEFTHPPVGSTWRQAVLQRTGVHPQWLNELELSVAGDFNMERVGAIFGPNQFSSLLPSLSAINMPIFISWGPISLANGVGHDASEYLKSKGFVPTIDEIEILETGRPLPQSPILRPSSSLPLPSSNPPLPPAKPHEDWSSFFLRREKANELTLLSESSIDKQARESRAKNALKNAAPGKKGARVFIWEDVDGHRIRKPAGRKHVDDIWEAYGDQQRRYDAFRDEWDICTEFGEDDRDSDDDDYGDTDHTLHQDFPMVNEDLVQPDEQSAASDSLSDLLPPEPLLLPVGPESSIADLRCNHDLDNAGDLESPFFSGTAEDRAYHWYGFITPDSVVTPPLDVKTNWSACREYLGNGRWLDHSTITAPAFSASTSTQELMCSFFDKLFNSRKIDDLPGALYDLTTQDYDQSSVVCLRSETIEGIQHFFLQPHEMKRPAGVMWEVKLTSAPAVVGILRRQEHLDYIGLVTMLLDMGIPFQTCITGPPNVLPRPVRPRYSGLGYRPPNYRPDAQDYAAYLSHRDNLLRGPRGRAALLHGGIISRLAKEVVQYQHVLDGPTNEVFETGAMLRGTTGVGYWDDALTEHEIYIICGVYKVDTDSTMNPQTSDLSWWPKPSAWDHAGINLGFWSEDCERWFQNQLTKFRNGDFILKSSSTWRNGVKFNRNTLKITSKNEKLAAEKHIRDNSPTRHPRMATAAVRNLYPLPPLYTGPSPISHVDPIPLMTQLRSAPGVITPQFPPTLLPPSSSRLTMPQHRRARRIPVIAMWSRSRLRAMENIEEWTVYHTGHPIRIESIEPGDEASLLRPGDIFDILVIDLEGKLRRYISLQTVALEEPDFPLFLTLCTWSSKNSTIYLHIPLSCVSMKFCTLFRYLNICDEDAAIDPFPTMMITDPYIQSAHNGDQFLCPAAREILDPDDTFQNYIFTLPP
ncbi:hypothetical protein H0H93_007563 [Arthromyces matolae]|nr:hypothetical protein H0H93_007563 [Arthromyces matolae]